MGNHYYDRDGNSRHEVLAKTSGKIRATTIRDARENGWLPSVTTILGILDKPALTNWKLTHAVEATEKNPRFPDEPTGKYVARMNRVAKDIASKAAAEGTRIHDALETWMTRSGKIPDAYRTHVLAVAGLLPTIVEGWGDAEKVPEERLVGIGYAGMCDLQVPEKNVVLDYKTKDFDMEKATKLKGYFDQGMQLAAYAGASKKIELHKARLINVFVSRDNPGLVTYYEHKDPVWLYEAFMSLVRFWHIQNPGLLDRYENDWLDMPGRVT